MKRPSWAEGAALTLSLAALACGDGESKAKPTPDGGTGGTTSDSGAGGEPQGGGPGAGGSSPEASPPEDTTPPTFTGATGAAEVAEDRIRVSWNAASDDLTPSERIGYRVYRASESGGQDFTRGRRCGTDVLDAGRDDQARMPCFRTAAAGATSAIVTDSVPEHTYYYVVRAVDAAGNEDANTQEISAKTSDVTNPEFGGVNSVTVLTASSIRVEWGLAYDRSTTDANLIFHVFVQKDGDPVPTTPSHISGPGEHSAVVGGLSPRTLYTVWVKVVDPKGNIGGGSFTLGVTTPEGVPPTFSGLKRANVEGRTVRLFWEPASDNTTDYAAIVYDVYSYQATAPSCTHRQDFTRPPRLSSQPGASSITLEEPEEGTRYCYVVRARDAAGNQETNTVELGMVTEVSDIRPPTFNGISSLVSESATSVKASWPPANDDTTTSARFVYDVFLSTTTPVPLTTPMITLRGATTVTLGGLSPATQYHVAVRATDEAGHPNSASPAVERTATTLAAGTDTTPPVGGGATVATLLPGYPERLSVTWPAATDDTSAAADIRYHVCASNVATDCDGTRFFSHALSTTNWGVASATLTFLESRTEYTVSVRAEDRAGNIQGTATPADREITATSWSEDVLPVVLERCFACHEKYDQPSNVVYVGSSYYEDSACTGAPPDSGAGCQLALVDPGRPAVSMLYRKINVVGLELAPFSAQTPNRYNGLQMPRDSSGRLTAEEIDAIHDWILQGANAN